MAQVHVEAIELRLEIRGVPAIRTDGRQRVVGPSNRIADGPRMRCLPHEDTSLVRYAIIVSITVLLDGEPLLYVTVLAGVEYF